ncbi:MAG: ester cyclase [Acidimicrobiales bacterium]
MSDELDLTRSEYVMRTYLERVVQHGEVALLADIAAEDMVDHSARMAGWGEGRAGLLGHVNWFRSTIKDPKVTIHHLVAGRETDGREAAVAYWSATGILTGAFFGREADGQPVTSVATSWFWLRDGMLAEYRAVADATAIARAGTRPA